MKQHAVAVLLAVLSFACAHEQPVPTTATPTPTSTPTRTPTPDTVPCNCNPADLQFMSGMIAHHAQAIAMAKLAPTHGASESLRILAGRIINAQQDEIVLLQAWLLKHGQEAHAHEHAMPGMLTPAQMQELDRARGTDFDQVFLFYMIQHHQGALTMVKELLGAQGAARDNTVFKMASDISADQSTEIARMQKMLAAMTSKPRSQL